MSHQRMLDSSARALPTITVPREEYDSLRATARRFEMMRNLFELDFFAPPPTRDSGVVIRELEKTGKYNKSFLKSLERGLKNSTYFHKAHSR